MKQKEIKNTFNIHLFIYSLTFQRQTSGPQMYTLNTASLPRLVVDISNSIINICLLCSVKLFMCKVYEHQFKFFSTQSDGK